MEKRITRSKSTLSYQKRQDATQLSSQASSSQTSPQRQLPQGTAPLSSGHSSQHASRRSLASTSGRRYTKSGSPRSANSIQSLVFPARRALALLCAASAFAGKTFAPVQEVSALAISSSLYSDVATDASQASIAASVAGPSNGKSAEQQGSQHQHRQRRVPLGRRAAEPVTASSSRSSSSKSRASSSASTSSSSSASYSFSSESRVASSSRLTATASSSAASSSASASRTNATSIVPLGVSATALLNATASSSASTSSSTAKSTPFGRWGQASAFLESDNAVVFVGGQTSDSMGLKLTEDVYVLNVTDLITNSTSGPKDTWRHLAYDGTLPPHAFAASTVTGANSSDERLWLMGGYTGNCSAAPGWYMDTSSLLHGNWSDITSEGTGLYNRKAEALAMQVPVAGNASEKSHSSYMVLGGKNASSLCSVLDRRDDQNTSGLTANIWTLPTASKANESSTTLNTYAVDASKSAGSFSLVDYSVVTYPKTSNVTAGINGTTMFFGGLTATGQFADWDNFWSFNAWTGNWTNWTSTGDIPSPRKGQSSTLLKDGRVVVIGGLLQNGTNSNDVYIMEPKNTTAKWTLATLAKNNTVEAPVAAYHSAVLVGDVIVTAFGANDINATASAAANKTRRADEDESRYVRFLDTASVGGWRWSKTIEAVMKARGVESERATVPVASSSSISSSTSSSKSTGSSVSSTKSTSTERTTTLSTSTRASTSRQASATSDSAPVSSADSSVVRSSAAPVAHTTATTSARESASTPAAESSSNSGSGSDSESASPATSAIVSSATHESKQSSPSKTSSHAASATASETSASSSSGTLSAGEKSGAVVGSLLGAAALAAALGGLYAYKKRKEAREYGIMQADMENRDHSQAPPVSMLWLHNLKRRATLESFKVLNVSSPSANSAVPAMPPRQDRLGDDYGEATPCLPQRNGGVFLTAPTNLPYANASSESVNSIAASHYSYPYLSAVHRGSVNDQTSPTMTEADALATPSLYSQRGGTAMNTPQIMPMSSPKTNHRNSSQILAADWAPELGELSSSALYRAVLRQSMDYSRDSMNDGFRTLRSPSIERRSPSLTRKTSSATQSLIKQQRAAYKAGSPSPAWTSIPLNESPVQEKRQSFAENPYVAMPPVAAAEKSRRHARMASLQRSRMSSLRVTNSNGDVLASSPDM